MSISFSGLASGLDTSSWITSLTQLRQAKVTTLEAQKANVVSAQSTLQSIRSFFSTFRSTIEKITDSKFNSTVSNIFAKKTALSSNLAAVTATVKSGAAEGTYEVSVKQTATQTQAKSGYRYTTTLISTTQAKTSSSLSNVGVGYGVNEGSGIKSGEVDIRHDGVTTQIFISSDETMESFLDKLHNEAHVEAEFDNQTGIFSIGVSAEDIIDVGNTGILSKLKISSINYGYTGSQLSIEESHDEYEQATRDTLLSALGVRAGHLTINTAVDVYDVELGNDDTIGSLVDALREEGIEAAFSDGVFSINNAYISNDGDTHLIEAFGLTTPDVARQTQEKGGLKFQTIWTETTTASGTTLLCNIDGVSLDGEKTINVKNASGVISTITVDTETTINDLVAAFNDENVGLTAAFDPETGRLSISDGWIVSGGTFEDIESAFGLVYTPVAQTETGSRLTVTTMTVTGATGGTTLKDLTTEVTSGNIDVTDNMGVVHHVTINQNSTINDFVTQVRGLGLGAEFNDATGVLTLTGGSYAAVYNEDDEIDASNILSVFFNSNSLEATSVNSSAASSVALRVETTSTHTATGTVTMSQLGLADGTYEATFRTGSTDIVATITQNTTLSEFESDLRSKGLDITFNAGTGKFTIEDGEYLGVNTGTFGEIMDFSSVITGRYATSSEVLAQTVTIGNELTSAGIVYHTISYITTISTTTYDTVVMTSTGGPVTYQTTATTQTAATAGVDITGDSLTYGSVTTTAAGQTSGVLSYVVIGTTEGQTVTIGSEMTSSQLDALVSIGVVQTSDLLSYQTIIDNAGTYVTLGLSITGEEFGELFSVIQPITSEELCSGSERIMAYSKQLTLLNDSAVEIKGADSSYSNTNNSITIKQILTDYADSTVVVSGTLRAHDGWEYYFDNETVATVIGVLTEQGILEGYSDGIYSTTTGDGYYDKGISYVDGTLASTLFHTYLNLEGGSFGKGESWDYVDDFIDEGIVNSVTATGAGTERAARLDALVSSITQNATATTVGDAIEAIQTRAYDGTGKYTDYVYVTSAADFTAILEAVEHAGTQHAIADLSIILDFSGSVVYDTKNFKNIAEKHLHCTIVATSTSNVTIDAINTSYDKSALFGDLGESCVAGITFNFINTDQISGLVKNNVTNSSLSDIAIVNFHGDHLFGDISNSAIDSMSVLYSLAYGYFIGDIESSSISNMYVESSVAYGEKSGFIHEVSESAISNLQFNNFQLMGVQDAAIFGGILDSEISSVYVNDSKVNASLANGGQASGFAHLVEGSSLSDIKLDMVVTSQGLAYGFARSIESSTILEAVTRGHVQANKEACGFVHEISSANISDSEIYMGVESLSAIAFAFYADALSDTSAFTGNIVRNCVGGGSCAALISKGDEYCTYQNNNFDMLINANRGNYSSESTVLYRSNRNTRNNSIMIRNSNNNAVWTNYEGNGYYIGSTNRFVSDSTPLSKINIATYKPGVNPQVSGQIFADNNTVSIGPYQTLSDIADALANIGVTLSSDGNTHTNHIDNTVLTSLTDIGSILHGYFNLAPGDTSSITSVQRAGTYIGPVTRVADLIGGTSYIKFREGSGIENFSITESTTFVEMGRALIDRGVMIDLREGHLIIEDALGIIDEFGDNLMSIFPNGIYMTDPGTSWEGITNGASTTFGEMGIVDYMPSYFILNDGTHVTVNSSDTITDVIAKLGTCGVTATFDHNMITFGYLNDTAAIADMTYDLASILFHKDPAQWQQNKSNILGEGVTYTTSVNYQTTISQLNPLIGATDFVTIHTNTTVIEGKGGNPIRDIIDALAAAGITASIKDNRFVIESGSNYITSIDAPLAEALNISSGNNVSYTSFQIQSGDVLTTYGISTSSSSDVQIQSVVSDGAETIITYLQPDEVKNSSYNETTYITHTVTTTVAATFSEGGTQATGVMHFEEVQTTGGSTILTVNTMQQTSNVLMSNGVTATAGTTLSALDQWIGEGDIIYSDGTTMATSPFLGNTAFNITDAADVADAIENNDYIGIGSAEALEAFAIAVNNGTDCSGKTIYLTSDINLSGYDDWVGIGDSDTAFSGIFDGQGHTISNLTIDSSDGYKGLFGKVSGTIQNLKIEDVDIHTDGRYVGAIAGVLEGTLLNCYTTGGDIASESIYSSAGGLVGLLNGTISNSWSDLYVNGQQYVGGLVGEGMGTITNSYTTGDVQGESKAGGLIGQLDGNTSLNNVYAGGNVDASGSNSGRLIGYKGGTSLYAVDVTVKKGINDGVQMIGDTVSFDSLVSESSANSIKTTFLDNMINVIDGAFMAEAIANSNQIGIGSADALYALATIVNSGTNCKYKTFYLTSDIDLSDYADWVGIGSSSNNFVGTFDGQGYVISNLTITSSGNYKGLFGKIGGSTNIKNVGIENVNIEASGNYVGALVGAGGTTSGVIENCYVSGGTVKSTATISYLGGLMGSSSGCLGDCWSDVTVDGKQYVGGLVGQMHGTIKDSYTSGDVSGKSNVGGLIGRLNNALVIDDVYAGGTVTGTGSNIGRLVGTSGSYSLTATDTYVQSGINTTLRMVGNTTNYDASISEIETNTVEAGYTGTYKINVINGADMADAIASSNHIGIGSAEALYALATIVNSGTIRTGKTFYLTSDIDLSDYADWVGIGSSSNNFVGTFDGQGHVISNLTITSSGSYKGLFGYTSTSATIKNVGIENVNIEISGAYAGALVGYNAGSRIFNCYASGGTIKSTATDSYAGGLCGRCTAGTIIDDCWSDVTVDGKQYVGGLVGQMCGTIKDSYTSGDVSGTSNVGGLIGQLYGITTLDNVYAGGNVSASDSNKGRLMGSANNKTLNVTGAYVQSDINTTLQMIGNTNSYDASISAVTSNPFDEPELIGNKTFNVINGVDMWDAVLNNDYIGIGSAEALNALATIINYGINTTGKTFVLTNDIDLSDYTNWQRIGTGQTGIDGSNLSFRGVFDGQGHTISNLTISDVSDEFAGLFGRITNAGTIVRNVGLTNVNVSANCNSVGALVGGAFNGAAISNCYVSGGTVTSSGNYTGGIIGRMTDLVVISDTFADVTVSGVNSVGGIAGACIGTIRNSYAIGSASGTHLVGGLVGYTQPSESITLENVYSGVTVTCAGTAGRLLGKLSNASITDAYVESGINAGMRKVGNTANYDSYISEVDRNLLVSNIYNQFTIHVNGTDTVSDLMTKLNTAGYTTSLDNGVITAREMGSSFVLSMSDNLSDLLGINTGAGYSYDTNIEGGTVLISTDIASGDDLLKDYGCIGNVTIVTNNGTITHAECSSIDSFISKLASKGIGASINNGILSIGTNSDTGYITSMSANFANAFGFSAGEGITYYVDDMPRYDIGYSLDTTMSAIGLTENGVIEHSEGFITINTTDTLGTALSKLDQAGLVVDYDVETGELNLLDDSSGIYLKDMSHDLANVLGGIIFGLGSTYNTTGNSTTVAATENTALNRLGIIYGESIAVNNGRIGQKAYYTVNMDSTLGDIISFMNSNGMDVSLSEGGRLKINSGSYGYVDDDLSSSQIMEVLGLWDNGVADCSRSITYHINGDTTLAQMGLIPEQTIETNSGVHTFNASDTLDDIREALISDGIYFDVDEDRGRVHISSNSGANYVKSMSSGLQNALNLEIGEGKSYRVNVTAQYTTNTVTASLGDTLGTLSLTADGTITVQELDGTFTVVSISTSDTVQTLLDKLDTVGVTATFANGVVTLGNASDESVITNMSSTLKSFLNIDSGLGSSYTTLSMDVTEDTQLSFLGITGADTGVITTESDRYTFGSSDTIGDIISALETNGINVDITDGVITFSPTEGHYIKSISSNLELALHVEAGYDESYGVNYTPPSSTTTTIAATGSTTMSSLGMSTSGTIYTNNGTVTIQSTDTVQDVIDKLGTAGVSAYYNNVTGEFTLGAHSQIETVITSGTDMAAAIANCDHIGIASAEALYALATITNVLTSITAGKTFYLTEDIDLSSYANWVGIGSGTNSFNGTFDGQGHVVSNLKITSGSSKGLFGYTSRATIKNVGVEDVNISTSGNYVGALVGNSKYTSIENCYVSGGTISSTATNNYFGGLVGCNDGGTITNSWTDVTVNGDQTVGGLVGTTTGGSITNCYALGNVSGTNYIGGLVGRLGSGFTISNAYTEGTITASGSNVGRIIGLANMIIASDVYAKSGTNAGMRYIGNTTSYDSNFSEAASNPFQNPGFIATVMPPAMVEANDTNYVTGMSQNMTSALGNISTGQGFTYNIEQSDNDAETSTTMSQLGMSSGTAYIRLNTDTVTVTSTSTIQDIIDGLGSVGITATLNEDSQLVINAGDGVYVESISASLANALQIEAGNNISYRITPEIIGTTSTIADSNTTLSTLGMSSSGKIFTNGVTVTIQSTDTVQDVIDKLSTEAGVSAYYNNVTGEFTIGAHSAIQTVITSGTDMADAIANCDHIGIASAEALYALATITNAQTSITAGKTFYLTEDIDLSGYANWVGIGSGKNFLGTFDGQGHVVSNLKITSGNFKGLFGVANGATIKNVGIEDVNISTAGSYVGALVGSAYTTSIENCYVSGGTVSSTSTYSYIGGLVGSSSGTITNSWTDVTVSGKYIVGGLVGSASGSITNCYALGNVSGTNHIGGLVGYVSSAITISNAYTEGTVTASGSNVGRIIGFTDNNITISDVYAKSGTNAGMRYIGGTTSYDSNISEAASNPFNNTGFIGSTAPTLIEDDTNYVTGMSQNLTAALGNISTGQGFTYNITSNTEVEEDTAYSISAITTEKTFEGIGITSTGGVLNLSNGETVTVKNDTTVASFITDMGNKGFDVTLTNGIFNIQAQNGTDYIVDCTDENVLAAMNIVGSTYSTNTLNLGSTKLKDLKNSLGENLGITTGNIKVYKNGLENTINISNETTLDQLASILADYNIQMVYGLGSSDTIRFNSYPSGNSYMEEVGGGTNLLTQLGITSWGTHKDSQTQELKYTTDSDIIVDTNTKLVNLKRTDGTSVGITEGNYKIVANGMNYIGTIDATTSISDFFTDLARYGITGTLNSNGQINLSSTQANTYLVAAEGADGYSNIVDTLFPSWSYGNVYVSNSMDVTNTSTSNMTATTRLKDIDQGTYQAGKFVVSRNGVNTTVTLSENATVEDFMSAIRPYGFTSYINNGQVVVENDGVATLTDYETPSERTNVVSLLGLDPSTWEQPGYYTGLECTTTNYHTELRAATRDTKLSDLRNAEGDSLGITTGEYYVYSNGIRHTLNIDSTDITIENFTNALSTYGINAIYENNGTQTTLKISANGDSYVETSTALTDTTNIVDVLFHNSKATLYSYEGYEQTTTNVTTTAIASLATSVSDYNQGTSLSEGTLALYVDGNYREIEVTSYETFGSLLEKFERAGVTASLNDGVMRLETGNTSFSIDTENSTSNLITNLGLSYNDNLGGFAASTGAVTQTTTTVESRTLSVAKYADYDTQMSLLNISSGTVSIYKNGMKRSITIDNTENFSDFRAKIQTAFEGDIDIDFRNGKLRFFSTEEGVDVQVGSSNDTSNISSICGFIQNENGDIISSRELYKVNASSKITTEGLFRKGDVTTGTFVIGDETFTITENTTIQNIVAQINSSDKSNASAYWDSVDGKLIISSRTTGASIINIEAGTSNFTDILGLTQSEWDEGALERTKILTDSQTIGNNASFSINGTNFSSSSNVITSDVSRIQGLTLNLKSATPGQVVTVSITQDTEAVTDAVGEFVDAYNELIENVDNELATSGALKDQSTLKFIKQQIRNLIVNTFSGSMVFKNLAALGISTTNANAAAISTANVEYLYFDPEKFLEGYNKDPEAVKNMLVGSDETPGILLQIENIVENALATGTGYFSTADKSYSQQISGLNEKIKKANAAIEAYRARLETKFQSMDLLISQMQNQYNSFMNSTYSSSTLTY